MCQGNAELETLYVQYFLVDTLVWLNNGSKESSKNLIDWYGTEIFERQTVQQADKQ